MVLEKFFREGMSFESNDLVLALSNMLRYKNGFLELEGDEFAPVYYIHKGTIKAISFLKSREAVNKIYNDISKSLHLLGFRTDDEIKNITRESLFGQKKGIIYDRINDLLKNIGVEDKIVELLYEEVDINKENIMKSLNSLNSEKHSTKLYFFNNGMENENEEEAKKAQPINKILYFKEFSEPIVLDDKFFLDVTVLNEQRESSDKTFDEKFKDIFK